MLVSTSRSLAEQIGLKTPLQLENGDNKLDPLFFVWDVIGMPKLSFLYSISGLVLPLWGLGLPNIKSKKIEQKKKTYSSTILHF